MVKPNAASVTDVDCTCGYLERSAADPNLPIRFDPDLNEYHIVYVSPMGGRVVSLIYHCPFCGGAAPPSRRGELFAEVPEEEGERLRARVDGLETVEDLVAVLGPPNSDDLFDMPPDLVWPIDADGEGDPLPIRVMRYTDLSHVADVNVEVYPDESIRVCVVAKYIGAAREGV